MERGTTLWRYKRRFTIGAIAGEMILRSRTNGLFSELRLDGALVAQDATPAFGPEALRNHLLVARLHDDARLEVEAGYISTVNTAIAVRRDGELVHESHPGRVIAYPEKHRASTAAMEGATIGEAMKQSFRQGAAEAQAAGDIDLAAWKRNRVPLAVDIALGLLFFVVAKMTDLTTAAFVGAGIGVLLLGVQRLTRIDLLGGLAIYGILLLLLSAALAFAFQSDEAVKYRSSVIGLISAALFFVDGLAGGNRLATRLKRYLPYRGIDPARLGVGMGVFGAIMAGLNLVVAQLASTDVWLFYSTFADFGVAIVLIMLVFRYAQGNILRDLAPRYRPPDDGVPAR